MMSQSDKNRVIQLILESIDEEIAMLSMHAHLCTGALTRTVEKYKLHGSIDEATNQLNKIKQQLTNNPNTKATHELVDSINFRSVPIIDPYDVKIQEAFTEGDERKIRVMQERKLARIKTLHEKKECVCFQ